MTNGIFCCIIVKQQSNGSLVKRLRHGPLKAETGVRFSHESPEKESTQFRVLSFFLMPRGRTCSAPCAKRFGAEFETLLRRFRVGSLAGRSKFSHESALCSHHLFSNILPSVSLYSVFFLHVLPYRINRGTRLGAGRLTLDEKYGIISSPKIKNLTSS